MQKGYSRSGGELIPFVCVKIAPAVICPLDELLFAKWFVIPLEEVSKARGLKSSSSSSSISSPSDFDPLDEFCDDAEESFLRRAYYRMKLKSILEGAIFCKCSCNIPHEIVVE